MTAQHHGDGACACAASRALSAASSDEGSGSEEKGGPNTTDVGKVPKGKEELAAKLRPAVPGVWYGDERFVIMFTCTKCGTRTAKTVSKQAYNHGVVLIRCPGCESLHLMADRLGWFAEQGKRGVDVVGLMKAKGETVRAISRHNAALGGAEAGGGGEGDASAALDDVSAPASGARAAAPALGDASGDASASGGPPSPARPPGEGEGVGPPSGEGEGAGPSELDLELMAGVMELTEEDIRVLQAEGAFVSPDGGDEEGGGGRA